MNTDIDLSMIRYYIYIYTYEYICVYIYPPRSTFWVADMSLTSLFLLLILSLVGAVVALQQESTFSEGNAATKQRTHTHIYI